MERIFRGIALVVAVGALECSRQGPVAPPSRSGAGVGEGAQVTIAGDPGQGGLELMGTGVGLAVGGVGLNTQPGTLTVGVPGTPITALLVWSGISANMAGDNEILLDGTPVTGTPLIPEQGSDGTWTVAFWADVTARVSTGLNTFSLSGLSMLENDGAGLLVGHEGGTRKVIRILAGPRADLFWVGMPDPSQRNSRVHRLGFPPLPVDNQGRLTVLAGNCRPTQGDAIWAKVGSGPVPTNLIGGPGTVIGTDVLSSGDGDQWDTFQHDIAIPVGSEWVAAQIESPASRGGDSGVFVAMAVEINPCTPPPPPPGGFRTIGFWKHQVNVALGGPGHAQIDADSLEALLALVQAVPGVDCVDFDRGDGSISLEDADAVLEAPNPMTAEQKARRQVLAALLNFVAFNGSNGSLMVDTTCDCVPDMTYQDFLDDALDVLCPPGSSSKSEYNRINGAADCLNNQESCGP